jgi:hypothetical protein
VYGTSISISLYYRAVLSNIHRLGIDEPERPRIMITRREGIRGQATKSHSVTPGRYSITSDRAKGEGAYGLKGILVLCRCEESLAESETIRRIGRG